MQFIDTASSRTSQVVTTGGMSERGRTSATRLKGMQRFLIAFFLCLGFVSLAGNAQAQFVKYVTGYLLPTQTNVFYPRDLSNSSTDTIYVISGVYSISGRLEIREGAEVRFLPNSRIVDSTGGKIIANGFTGLQRRIYLHGMPVNSNSVEWGHILVLPGADSVIFANVRFSNFKKLNTVDKLYIYGVNPTALINANEIIRVSNGTGAVMTTFSARTYIYDAIVDSCQAIYRGGAFAFLQAPSQSYFPADDGRLALANSQVRRLIIRDTRVFDNDNAAGGPLWNTTNALGGAIYMSARVGATAGNYVATFLGNRPGPFFPASQDTLVFERCVARNANAATTSGINVARGGGIYVGQFTGLTISQASFNTDSAVAAQPAPATSFGTGEQGNAWGGAIAASSTSGSPFFLPPPAPGFDRLPGLAVIKRANFNQCVAGFGGAIHCDFGFNTAPALNINAENIIASTGVRDSGLITFNGNTAYYDGGAIYTSWYTYITGYLAPRQGVFDLVNAVIVPASQVELRVKFANNVAGIAGGSIFLNPFQNNTNPDIQSRRVWHEGNSVNPRDARINRTDLATTVLGGGAEFVGLRDSAFAVEYHGNFVQGGNGGAVLMNGPQGYLTFGINRFFVWDKYNASNTTISPLPFDQRELTRFCENSAMLGTPADSAGIFNRSGRGGALFIDVTNKTNPVLAQDSTFFTRVRIEKNNAYTGSAIYSDNYDMRLISNLTLIANNHATSPSSVSVDLNNLLGNPADLNASATIWGEWEGSLPGYETNSRGNAVYDNVARYILRLPSSPGVGFGGTDTLRGNFWGETGPDVITVLPSGALQSTFFIDYWRQGCTTNVYEPNRRPQMSYQAIPVGQIPDTLLMEGRVYDIFDAGTDIKTVDYSVRRLAIAEDFALGEPTDLGYANVNPLIDHRGLHRFTRSIFDTNAVYINKILTMQVDFTGPHPIGYPLFLQADVDTNDANRDRCARNYTVLYVINTTTNEFVRVNAKETLVDEPTGVTAKYQGRLDFVPDSATGTGVNGRHPQSRARVLWTLSLLRPLTFPATFAEIQRAAMLEDSAALAGRIYTLDTADYRGPGADSVCTMGIMNKAVWYAGERYHTLPVRPGDNILVVSRTQLWKYGAAGAIARGLSFPIGDVLPPLFTSDVQNLMNLPNTPNDLFVREDVNYDGVNKILFRIAGYDRNNFYDPRFLFNPFNFTQVKFELSGYKTHADSNNTRIAWWLRDTTLFNVNVTGSNGYVLLKGQPHNPDVVPGGEAVTAKITNFPPNFNSENGLLGHGFGLGPDSLNLSMWTFPPFFNCPTGFQTDTLCVRSTSTSYTFRVFVQDSLPVFTSSPSTACAANLTDSLRYSYDVQTDDESEDSTAQAITTAYQAKDPVNNRAFDFRFGRTSYKYVVAPSWLKYALSHPGSNVAQFVTKGQINVRIDSATIYPFITPIPQINGEFNLDTLVVVQADDGHTGLSQQRWRLPINVEPHIITDTLPNAKEDFDYSLDFHNPNNVPRIIITDANFADFHTYQLLYEGQTDTVYRDAHFKTGRAILVGHTPTWLQIDPSSGILTGTPGIHDAPRTSALCKGPDSVTVIVQDQCGLTAWKTLALTVDSTNHLPRFARGPRTFCVLNRQAFCDTVSVSDRDLLRDSCAHEVLTLSSLDSNFRVTPVTITGPTKDTQLVSVCGKFDLDQTYFSQNPPPPQYIRLQVKDAAGHIDTVNYRIYVGDQPTFECAIYVSNIGTSTHPTDIQRLCFGAGRFGTDSLDIRYCEFEEPPPAPSAVFDSRWELPIGGSIKGTYLDIRRDTAQFTNVTWQVRFQSGAEGSTFLFPIHICWKPSCLDSTGSFQGQFYLQDPFDPGEFSINMRTGQGPINPSFYTLIKVGADSLCLEIRNVQLANARIVFAPTKSAVAANAQPREFALEQNYPNPFNPSTTLNFSVPSRSDVKIDIYDVKGSLVRTLVHEQLSAGEYPVMWDGTDAAGNVVTSGTYVAKMTAGTYTSTIKMTLKK
jgi:predicted outer membrane repeat protein